MEKLKKGASSVSKEQNPEGVSVEAKEMLLENGKKETKIRYTDKKTIELLQDTKYQKAGKIYTTSKTKADWLIEKKIAKEVK